VFKITKTHYTVYFLANAVYFIFCNNGVENKRQISMLYCKENVTNAIFSGKLKVIGNLSISIEGRK
jgi:hypothetical protein